MTGSGNGATLFMPFRDATSGQETYASGRYIELKENTSGIYDLDFNRAYNPYCAYNSEFSCPVPPAENILKVPIRAGEKNYNSPATINPVRRRTITREKMRRRGLKSTNPIPIPIPIPTPDS